MNLKTTLVLLVLGVAGAGWFYCSPTLPSWLGSTAPPAATITSATAVILENDLQPDKLSRIELRYPDRRLILERSPQGEWLLPGKWPVRTHEVDALVGLLTSIRSRFVPIPINDAADLEKYGLDKPSVTILVKTKDDDKTREIRLTFAEDPNESNRLSRITYLRVAAQDGQGLRDLDEVLQLAPGLVLQLDRPIDYYQQRRLFPSERVVQASGGQPGGATEKIERLAAQGIAAKGPSGDFSLVRVGQDWELKEPSRDRADPEKVQSLLTTVPDIWAEHFVRDPKKGPADYGLDKPEQTLSITRGANDVVTLLIGKESPRTSERRVTRPMPPGMPPGMPPMTDKIVESFRYAKLAGNDQIFEIKADKLKDIFVGLDTLRDARLARFRAEDVQRIELTLKDLTLVIARKDDKYRLEKPFESDAERSKVLDLVDKLADLQARGPDVIDKADAKEYSLEPPAGQVVLTVEEEAKGGKDEDKQKKTRTIKFLIGKHDAALKKLFVKVDDFPRINKVDDALFKLIERPALAYRGRGIFTFDSKGLAGIEVERGSEKYALKKKDSTWRLATPVDADADPALADNLVRRLTGLEAVEYVTESAKDEDLETLYGLAKPALSVSLNLGEGKAAPKLLIGKQRGTEGEVFAELEGAPQVFVLRKDVREAFDQPSLALRPLQLWQVPLEDVASLRIQRQDEPEYTLKREGMTWKLSGPFDAGVQAPAVQALLASLSALRVDRYETHAAKELEPFGLDKPAIRLVVRQADKDKDAGKEHVLLIGKPTAVDAKTRYAKLANSDAILIVGPAVVSAADHGALDLLDRNLLILDTKNLTRFRSTAGENTLTLEHKDKSWQADTGAAKFSPDQEALGGLLAIWANLRADKFAAYGSKLDLAKFGLDKPSTTVTVTEQKPGDDGKPGKAVEHTLALGKDVEGTKGERYARLDDSPGVVVLPSFVVTELSRSYLDFVDRTLLDFDGKDVNTIQRKMGATELELTKGDDGWRIAKPDAHKADGPGLDRLLQQLAKLRAVRIAAYPLKDLKPFGLDDPAVILTLRQPDGEGKTKDRIVKIGDVADEAGKTNGDRFALVDGTDKVAVLPGALVRQLTARPIAFRDRAIAKFADADKAILERGLRKATFTRVDGNWKLSEPADAKVDQNDLDDFINALGRLRADELIADKPEDLKPYGLERPEARWRFLIGDKEVLSLVIGDREKTKTGEPSRVYAKLAGGDVVFLLDAKLTSRVLAEYRNRSLWEPIDASQVERIDFTAGGGDPQRKTFALEKINETWQVAGKAEAKVNTAAVSDALAALANLRAEQWIVDKDADLKLYGLDPPHLTVEIRTKSGAKRQIHIGGRQGESQLRYARLAEPNRSDVFVLAEADAAKIVRDLAGFLQAAEKPKGE